MKRVLVCGAGWAGMNAARILAQRGHSVRILEKSDHPGGRINSEVVNGFTLDAGFQVVNPAYAELQETGVLERVTIYPLPKGVEILDGEKLRLVGDFRQSLRYLADDVSSWSGSIRAKIALLRYLRSTAADLSFGAATIELADLYERVLAPFLTGVFLTDPAEVSNKMARELIHWFLKGAPGVPAGGVGEISRVLAAELDIEFGVEVISVSKSEVQTSNGREEADAVIVALDPVGAAALLGVEAPRMNQSTTWYFKCDRGLLSSKHLRLGGVGPVINSVVISNTAPSYAPPESSLLAATTLSLGDEDQVRRQLAALWRINPSELDLIKRWEIPHSLPFHAPGVALARTALMESGIYVAGDWRNVPSQQGALVSGRIAANAISAGKSIP